jgi:hypothetical protein
MEDLQSFVLINSLRTKTLNNPFVSGKRHKKRGSKCTFVIAMEKILLEEEMLSHSRPSLLAA